MAVHMPSRTHYSKKNTERQNINHKPCSFGDNDMNQVFHNKPIAINCEMRHFYELFALSPKQVEICTMAEYHLPAKE